MISNTLKQRDEIEEKYKWKIETVYPSVEDWEKDYKKAEELAAGFGRFAGRLGEGAGVLLEALKERDLISVTAERVYVYAHMKSDEDTREPRFQELNGRAQQLMAKISAALSWLVPEITSLPEGTVEGYLSESEELGVYAYHLSEILRAKKHVLSKETEEVLAKLSEVIGAPGQIFNMINNADIKFGNITDESGREVTLSHGNYVSMLESKNARVRKDAYEALYKAFKAQKNTLASTYYYNVRKNAVISSMRNYGSSLERALDGDFIPESVYTNLIEVINKNLGTLHRYIGLKKKILKLDEFHMYDVYAQLADMPDKSVPYEEALELVKKAVEPLGRQYVEDMTAGIGSGWIDVFENEGKRSGAYSFGTKDTMPFVLLNYNNKFKDAFTIIHELGHSMNSYYTWKKQPYIYSSHSIFTAEVASTVNECLLMRYLLDGTRDRQEKLYLLNIYLEEFRATVFRQTMFAEFELAAHRAVESGEMLTADSLCEIYGSLNSRYFGESVVYDDLIPMEWARIPHFYTAFYVFKYATGYSAAVDISSKLLKGSEADRKAYLDFLAAGDSDHPIELLKKAGADMSTPEVVERAMQTFKELVDELEELVND